MSEEKKPEPKPARAPPEPINEEVLKGVWIDGIGIHVSAEYIILEGVVTHPRSSKNYVVARMMFTPRLLERTCKSLERALEGYKELIKKREKEQK